MMIGGRLGYIIFYNYDYYFKNFSEVFMIWNGGMSFHGGLIGIIVATKIFSINNKIKTFILLDLIALVAPIGIFLGRIANFINSELYGRETEVIWSVKFILVDELLRHPSQLYESFFEGILLFLLLNFLSKKDNFKNPGIISSMFLILYSFFRFILEFFREPDSHIGYLFYNLSLGQIISIVFLVIGIFLFLLKYEKYE